MDLSVKKEYKTSFFFLIAVIISLLIYLLGCHLIKNNHSLQEAATVTAHFFPEDQQFIRPEPYERAFFIFGVVCLPVVSVLAYWFLLIIDKKRPHFFNFTAYRNFNRLKHLLAVTLLFIWGYFILKTTAGYGATWQNYFKIHHNHYLFRLSFLIVTAIVLLKIRWPKIKPAFIFSLALVILAATSFTQMRPETVFLSTGDTTFHFSVLLGAINQVYHGLTILTDISSQYGILYPYFMSALSHIFGYSITKISIFFTFLIFLSYFFIYLALRNLFGKKSWFGLFALLFIVGISHPFFECLILRGRQNLPYYQYFPLRVIFSAFFVWYIWRYLKKATGSTYVFGFAMCGLAMLWNLDTGLPVALSWTGFLIYTTLAQKRWSSREKILKSMGHIGSLVITGIVSVMAYSFFAYWRSGQFPVWMDLLEFQELFYKTGYNMLPMKPIDLWNIMLYVYFAVFLDSMIALMHGRATDKDKFRFFLSILGVGVFVYYQGRSHLLNLFPVSYPCLLLMASIVYDFRQNYSLGLNNWKNQFNNNLFGWNLLKVIPLFIVITYGILNFITEAPSVVQWDKFALKELNAPVVLDKRLAEAVQFINSHKKNKRLVIISDYNDYLYYKTNTYSALPFSSLIEVLSLEQIEVIKKVIQEKKVEDIFYIESGNNLLVSSIMEDIKDNYLEAARHESGSMIRYKRN